MTAAPDDPRSSTLRDRGEFALIDLITAAAGGVGDDVLLGPGDDSAVVRTDGSVVVSTDVYVEGRHFRAAWSSAEDIGHRVVAAAVADVVAMGARPTAVVVGLSCPAQTEVAWLEGLARGIGAECREAGASLAGGDLSRSDATFICVTALGSLDGQPPVTRAGARAGEQVALCGRVGYAAAGLAILSRGFRSGKDYIDAHRRPRPPYAEGVLARAGGATSMCDVSDGLIQDLGHIARASNVQIDLDSSAFEVPARMAEIASALGQDPMSWLLGGGDDHALVATFPPGELPAGWRRVGRTLEPDSVTDSEGAAAPVTVDSTIPTEMGWNHFSGS